MALYNFLIKNSRLLVWVFVAVMLFWGYSQSKERELDAQRIQTLESTATQLSSTVTQLADTMQQTAALMTRFNQMADDWEKQKNGNALRTDEQREANRKAAKDSGLDSVRIPDSIIDGMRQTAAEAANVAGSALRSDTSQPANTVPGSKDTRSNDGDGSGGRSDSGSK